MPVVTISQYARRRIISHYYCYYYYYLGVPVGQTSPERGGQELDERPGPDEQAALAGVHAHLLEVDAHEREQRAERGVEEEVERLDGEQLLVDGTEYQLDDVRLAAYPVRRVLGLRILFRVHLAQRFRVDARPDARRGERGPAAVARHLVRRRHARPEEPTTDTTYDGRYETDYDRLRPGDDARVLHTLTTTAGHLTRDGPTTTTRGAHTARTRTLRLRRTPDDDRVTLPDRLCAPRGAAARRAARARSPAAAAAGDTAVRQCRRRRRTGKNVRGKRAVRLGNDARPAPATGSVGPFVPYRIRGGVSRDLRA